MTLAFNNKIYLVDIEPVLDIQTGKNHLGIVKETAVYADKQEVGIQEYYSATDNKITLQAVYEIPEYAYHGEKYILSEDRTKQFEIYRVAKGRSLAYVKLPVKAVPQKYLLEGIQSG